MRKIIKYRTSYSQVHDCKNSRRLFRDFTCAIVATTMGDSIGDIIISYNVLLRITDGYEIRVRLPARRLNAFPVLQTNRSHLRILFDFYIALYDIIVSG